MSYGWGNVPDTVREQTEGVMEMLRDTLGSGLIGVYLHGSLALGSFQPERSDIDLIAVCQGDIDFLVKRVLTEQLLRRSNGPNPVEFHLCTLGQLQPWRHPCPFAFHYSERWRSRFAAAMANAEAEDSAGGRLEELAGGGAKELAGGGLEELAAFAGAEDPDLAAHVRVARERGVMLWGAPKGAAFPVVPDADFLSSVRADIDVPFRDVSKQPVYYVLNMLRVLRFQTDGAIVSKEEAGAWGMTALPIHIEVIADALKLYRRPEPQEALHFDVEPLQAFVHSCRRRLEL
jgi:hypothetical protein